MCGIVGYVGSSPAYDIVMGGLARLEYRGYDSAGVALLDGDGIMIRKRSGKIAELAAALASAPPAGNVGIGHTRWATHGAPTEPNAHPHTDCSGSLALIHNGIVENHAKLRDHLTKEGHQFRSDTDTEVLAHLIEARRATGADLADAVRSALSEIEGSCALAVISARDPGRIVAARRESPLVVGLAEGATLLASDIPALLPHTRRIMVVDDDRIVDLRADSVIVTDVGGKLVLPAVREVDWDLESAERAGYDHFMLKEIYEQPRAVSETLRGRAQDGYLALDELRVGEGTLRRIDKVFVVGCGTSYHAGLVAKYAIERWTRLPVEIDIASEFRYRDPVVDSRTLVIGVSQSGETIDTLAGFRYARELGGHTVAVANVVDSSMAREAEAVLYTRAGPEIGVAATKTFVAQMVAMELLALYLAQVRQTMTPTEAGTILDALHGLPSQIESVLAREHEVAALAGRFESVRDVFYLGRGPGYAVALEGALKLKEIAYLRAEGYPAGELKHGPIALIEPGVLVIGIATDSRVKPKLLSNIQEVRARQATVLLITNEGDSDAAALADHLFVVPRTCELLTPIVDVIPLQLFSYHMAVLRGHHVDQPRNLAKTVTVE
jgi:glutamine---fructose-6-phosphate transaminase (isomerizing)